MTVQPQVCQQVQAMLADWRGLDSGDQTAAIPQLVSDIVRVTAQNEEAVRAAALAEETGINRESLEVPKGLRCAEEAA